MDYLGDEATARMLYQDFKFHSIARLPGNEAWMKVAFHGPCASRQRDGDWQTTFYHHAHAEALCSRTRW